MRKKLTKEAKAYEAKLIACGSQTLPGIYLLTLPKVFPLSHTQAPIYNAQRKELLLSFSAIKNISPKYARGSYWDGDLLVRFMRDGKADIRLIFEPYEVEFIRNGIKVRISCEEYLLYVRTPSGHFVAEPYNKKIYEYTEEPDFSLLSSLRNAELWQQALERAGL